MPALVVRGWELFTDLVPRDVAAAVSWVHDDATRLSVPLSTCAVSLVHGDFWLVNAALEESDVVLLDRGVATLAAPALDLSCFLVGNATHVDPPARRSSTISSRCPATATTTPCSCAWFAALTELGWNKALDVVDNPDAATRAVASDELLWWASTARRIVDAGYLG